jgi:hypothetical protein
MQIRPTRLPRSNAFVRYELWFLCALSGKALVGTPEQVEATLARVGP